MTPSAARRSANGSLEPVGFSPMAKKPDQRVDLVGKRQRHADRRGRAGVVGTERLVMLGDGVGDARVFAVMQRVVAAHDPLQLGELADHAGREIGLCEMRRSLHQPANSLRRSRESGNPAANSRQFEPGRLDPACAGVTVQGAAQREIREPLDPVDLVEHAAELGVEDALLRARRRGPRGGTLRSWSQKKRASASRARSTRSLPATIAAPHHRSGCWRRTGIAARACRRDRGRRNISGACASR